MSTVNLVILGLLKDKSMSAYDIAQLMDSQVLGRLIKASAPAVYKNLRKMDKDQLLTSHTQKDGEMPEKRIYTVTDKGNDHFFDLMKQYSSNFAPFYMDFNAFLLNLDKLDKEKGLEMLNNLRSEIAKVKDWMVAHRAEATAAGIKIFFAGRMIMKQMDMILQVLVQWIDEVIEEYKQEDDLGKIPFMRM